MIVLRDGPATTDSGLEFLAHRLLWARRDQVPGEERLDEPLLDGEPLRIHKVVATDDYVAAIIERRGVDERGTALLVVRRSDAFARVIRPMAGAGDWALAIAGDTLWVSDPWGSGRPVKLYRYDLSQLEAL